MKKKLLLFSLFLFSVVFGLKAQQVNSWEFTSDIEGWGSPHNASVSNIDGAMAINVTGSDPSVSHPFSPDWNVGDAKYLWFRVKNTTPDNGGQIYFFHAGGFILISFPLTPNDTEYKDLYIDLTKNALWTPSLNINSIRLDIINGNGGETGLAYVDFVRFLNANPNPTSIVAKGLGNATAINGIGSTLQMLVDVLPEIGSSEVNWSVDNQAIATITPAGLLTAVSEGNVTVTATSKGAPTVISSVVISVTSQVILVSGITINSAGSEIQGLGNTLQMSAIFTPATASNKNVTYSVDKPEIATIDQVTGLLTSVSVGTVIITATSQDGTNISGTRSITVYTGQKNAWEFAFDLEGWGGVNSGTASVVDGAMAFDVTGVDPFINGPSFNPAWSANGLNTLWIRVKNTTADTEGTLYMLLDGASGGGYQSVTFSLTPNDTEFRDIYVDLTTNPKWNNTLKISNFRLDPIGGTSTGLVYVDFMRFIYQQKPVTWVNPPAIPFVTQYNQVFNTEWNNKMFYDQWETVEANIFTAADIAQGYLQFLFTAKRIMYTKSVYTSPYVIEAEMDYTGGSSRAGVVVRVADTNMDALQEPASGDPGFNREGIAFYPTDDGSSMIVQFTGAAIGTSTPVTRILVPKPVDVNSLRDKGTLKIEDFGTSVYVFYNNTPFFRIDLSNEANGIYTSGTVYNSNMVVAGTFTGMEVAVSGKVAFAERDAALRLYSVKIQTPTLWDMRPATTFVPQYSQVLDQSMDFTTFNDQWQTTDFTIAAEDVAAGYFQFVWVAKRILSTKNVYAAPYSLETDIDYSAGSNRGGVVLRVGLLNESIQDPGVDPGFNREGIAFYPTPDGGSMIVQFSGVEAGAATPITKILVPKPADVTSLMGRGKLRVEDYGTSIYVFYNGAPYIRIDLGDNTGSVYTSGTVYNSGMIVQGTFSGMEVEVLGKVAIAQRDASLRLYSATMQIVGAQGDMLSDRPVASFDKIEQTTFNTWNETAFKNAWDNIGTLGASNVVTGVDGHLMLGWLEPRIIATKSVYTIPNIVEVELGFPSASASAGVAIRVDPAVGIENIQEPGEILINPLFNREGIMFFAKPDGSGMYVQFSGAISAGNGYLTPITRIAVAAPAGVNLRDRGILRIEDFGTAIYVFYKDIPFLRVNLEGKVGVNYTSGGVYNAKMALQGVFSGMEIIESGKVGIAARQGDLTTESLDIYRITIKTPANVSDAPTNVTAVADNKQATVSFSAPVNNGGAAITKYTVTSSPGNYKQSGTSSPLVVTRLSNGTTYTFTVVATNVVGNSLASAESNSVTPATVSSAPTDVTAVAGNNQATVSFSAPLNDGGSAIINYTATSNPGNYTQTGSTSPLVVTGLNNGTAYTFTIVATNTVGNSIESAVSNEVAPMLTSINSNLESAVKVYQAGSAIVVELNGLSGVQNVYLIDIMGKTMVSKQSFGGEKLEISNRLISGVYFVRILGATKTQVTSIIIK